MSVKSFVFFIYVSIEHAQIIKKDRFRGVKKTSVYSKKDSFIIWKKEWNKKFRLSKYIKKKVCVCVCLFVIHAFGHDTTKCNEILQAIPFQPGEGRRVVFNPKFSSQGWLPLTYCWIYYNNYPSREFVHVIISHRKNDPAHV
jgi:hypothetical protein